jgi:hypothetical protein
MSVSTPVIVVDAPEVEPRLGKNQLRIELGYPTANFFKGEDPRGDRRIKQALRDAGKLNEVAVEQTEWIAARLREIEALKPGMTREDLMETFQEEGGLSGRTVQRFALRECPYIKADVRFEAVEGPEDDGTRSPRDKIVSISKPFLEWSIQD